MKTNTVPAMWTIPRLFSVSSWRALNTVLDVAFYDVAALTSREQDFLSAQTRPEGSILIVYPRASDSSIRSLSPRHFVNEQLSTGAEEVDTIVVAGVGSSALGTAALARNVADHLGRTVAGVVSGFGLSDLMTEALGGWFVLGARNMFRDGYARIFDSYSLEDHVRDTESHQDMKDYFESVGIDKDHFIYGSPDSTALLYLLLKLKTRIKLLVGHSKGNYSIENAMEGWVTASKNESKPSLYDFCIITLGAVVRFPPELTNVHQFIGEIDLFGRMNSRPTLERTSIHGAGHSLNSVIPGSLSVQQALTLAGCC